jgi:hypothetical protein
MTTFCCLRFETPPTWRTRSPYLYPRGTGCPSYTPRHWVLFSSPPTTLRASVEVIQPAYTQYLSMTLRVRVRVTLQLVVYRQSVRLGDTPLETHDLDLYFLTEHLRLQSLCNILSNERMGLSFAIAAGPRQCSHSQVLVPWDSWPHFTVSDTRLPQPGGPGPRIYIPQEQGGPVIAPDNGLSTLYSFGLTVERSLISTILLSCCTNPFP